MIRDAPEMVNNLKLATSSTRRVVYLQGSPILKLAFITRNTESKENAYLSYAMYV